MKKLTSLLLSAILLLMPVLGLAQSEGSIAYFQLSNPVLTINEEEPVVLDLSGLQLNFAAEESSDGVHLLAEIAANDQSAIAGYLSLDESGLHFIIDGLSSSFLIPMSVIEALIGEAVSELTSELPMLDSDLGVIGSADGPTSIFVAGDGFSADSFFSDEALLNFATAVENSNAAIEVGEPVEMTVMVNGASVTAQSISFVIPNTAIADITVAAYELFFSNEQFASGFAAAYSESGEELPTSDELRAVISESNLRAEGTICLLENEDMYLDAMLIVSDGEDEEAISITLQTISGETCDTIICRLQEEEDVIDFELSMYPNAVIAGKTDYKAVLSVTEADDAEDDVRFEFVYSAYLNEKSVVCDSYELTAQDSADTVTIGFTCYGDESVQGGSVSLGVTENGSLTQIEVGYDGTINGSAHDGELWGSMTTDSFEYATFTSDLHFGIDQSGKSIAYDFASLPELDITVSSDEASELIENELYNVLYGGIITLSTNVPMLASLVYAMLSE